MRQFVILVILSALALSACASPRLSVRDESCSKTADCKRPLRCIQQMCVPSASGKMNGPHLTVISLARAIFSAIKNQSPERLLALLPPESVVRKAALTIKEEPPEVLIKEIIKDSNRDLPYRWRRLLSFAARCKIDVTTLKFVKLMPFNIKHHGSNLAKLDRDLNIHVTDANGSSWKIDIESVHKLEGHWYLTDAEVEIDPFHRHNMKRCDPVPSDKSSSRAPITKETKETPTKLE